MEDFFPVRKREEGMVEKCSRLAKKYCHPMQIGTGLIFSSLGVAVTAAGVMYADGMNFVFQNAPHVASYLSNATDVSHSADYVRESYRGAMAQAMDAGWKQAPFSYCIGYYVGGKVREKISKLFGGR